MELGGKAGIPFSPSGQLSTMLWLNSSFPSPLSMYMHSGCGTLSSRPSEVCDQAEQPVTVSGRYPEPFTVDFAHTNSVWRNSWAVYQPMLFQILHHLILKGRCTDVTCLFLTRACSSVFTCFFQHQLGTRSPCVHELCRSPVSKISRISCVQPVAASRMKTPPDCVLSAVLRFENQINHHLNFTTIFKTHPKNYSFKKTGFSMTRS